MSHEMFMKYVADNKLNLEVIKAESTTHTAQEAADYCQCQLACIVKSLLLKSVDRFVLCLVPGDKRLDLNLLKLEFGNELRMATAEEVKIETGYSIGGVPPIGHLNKIKTIIIEGFPKDEKLYAAAGSATTMFSISLLKLSEVVK